MAEELKGEQGKKKKSKLMLILIVVFVLLAAGGAAAYFFLFMGSGEVSEVSVSGGVSETSDAQESSSEDTAIYVAMPRPFPFNSPGISRERMVQIEVQLMVRGQLNEELAKRHIPMIEGSLLQVFSASNADDLVTEAGKAQLRDKATAQIRKVMNNLEKSPVVEQVLFTGFVIQ